MLPIVFYAQITLVIDTFQLLKKIAMDKEQVNQDIPTKTVEEWLNNGALFVDVREKDEVLIVSYDVPNVINIPLSEFEMRFNEIPKDRDVVLVCRSGGRSMRAAGFLRNNGYTKVVNMQDGLILWIEKDFPTKGDKTAFFKYKKGKTNSSNDSNSSSKCC